MVRVLIDLKEFGDLAGAGPYLVRGTVADGDRGDTHGLHDLVEDLIDGRVQVCSICSQEEVRGFLRRGYDIVDAAAAMRPVLREVHQVVKEVSLGAVGVDAVESAAGRLAGLCNSLGRFGRGFIERSQLTDRCTARVDSVVAVAARRAGAVCHHDDKGRGRVFSGAAGSAVEQRAGPSERGLPVGTVGLVAAVAEARLAICAAVVKAVGKSRDIGGPALALVVLVHSSGERHKGNIDVVFSGILIRGQARQEIMDHILRLVGAGVVASLSSAGHTRRRIVDDQNIDRA